MWGVWLDAPEECRAACVAVIDGYVRDEAESNRRFDRRDKGPVLTFPSARDAGPACDALDALECVTDAWIERVR